MNLSCRVLVAVTDEKLRTSIQSLVKALPIQAFFANTSAEILAYLSSSEGTDLVIIDDVLTDTTPEIVCRAARQRAPKIDSYIAVMAARENPADALRAFSAGADEVLPKPLEMVPFLNACRRAQRFTTIERRQAEAIANLTEMLNAEKKGKAEKAAKPPGAAGEKDEIEEKAEEEKIAEAPTEKAPSSGSPHGLLHEDRRPVLVQQMEEAVKQAFIELEVAPEDCLSKPTNNSLLYGDFIGWQGVFLNKTSEWYDILFHFSHPGAEYLSQRLLKRTAHSDEDLLKAVSELVASVQRIHRERFGGAGNATGAVFCQHMASPRFSWIGEIGAPTHSQLLNIPKMTLVYDFHRSPGTARVKPVPSVEPGDIMNETIAASGQGRIPLISKGVVLTEERLRKIRTEVEATRNFWVIEPSLLARRLSNSIAGPA